MRLEGKVALISGGARGMGAEEAKLFAREGAKVVIGDLLESEGRKTQAEISQAGGEAHFVRLDVTNEEEWRSAIKETLSQFGRLDILVNNAGIRGMVSATTQIRLEDSTEENWDRVMDVNGKGVFLGTKHAIPAMRLSGGGSIVNISSISGIVGLGSDGAYPASKGAVRLLTKSTAIQYGKEGIRCNSVHPGFIDTPMNEVSWADPQRRVEREKVTPLGRIGLPRDVANGVLFLASDESSFITGSELIIDGGYLAQ